MNFTHRTKSAMNLFAIMSLSPACRYESEGRPRKTIRAQQLWFAILEAQVGRA